MANYNAAKSETIQLEVIARGSSGYVLDLDNISYSNSNTSVATVNGDGLVIVLADGEAQITANVTQNGETKTIDVQFKFFSDDYKVWLNGEESTVYACTVSAVPFNVWWPGHQRQSEQAETVSYISFSADEEVHCSMMSMRAVKYCRQIFMIYIIKT